jgi:hypothetical protein
LHAGFGGLADRACLAILLDILSNTQPPIMALNIVCGFLQTKMSQHLVCLGYHDLCKSSLVRYD